MLLGIAPLPRSSFYFDALPEGDAVPDFGRGGFGVRIIPGGVFVLHAVDFQMVVMRGALPGAHAGVLARLQELALHGLGGKILIPFHYDAVIALSYDFSCPSCFWHSCTLELSAQIIRPPVLHHLLYGLALVYFV